MRFRVKVNGEHLCDAGVSKNGSLSLGLIVPGMDPRADGADAEAITGEDATGSQAFLHVGGGENSQGKFEDATWLKWVEQTVAEGDQVLIEILPDGEISEPTIDTNARFSLGAICGKSTFLGWLRSLIPFTLAFDTSRRRRK